jgi:hypothetical protein
MAGVDETFTGRKYSSPDDYLSEKREEWAANTPLGRTMRVLWQVLDIMEDEDFWLTYTPAQRAQRLRALKAQLENPSHA